MTPRRQPFTPAAAGCSFHAACCCSCRVPFPFSRSIQPIRTTCRTRCGDGADHQRYRGHHCACGACLRITHRMHACTTQESTSWSRTGGVCPPLPFPIRCVHPTTHWRKPAVPAPNSNTRRYLDPRQQHTDAAITHAHMATRFAGLLESSDLHHPHAPSRDITIPVNFERRCDGRQVTTENHESTTQPDGEPTMFSWQWDQPDKEKEPRGKRMPETLSG